MTHPSTWMPEPNDPLWSLLEAECEGWLTEQQRADLDARLSGDEAAQRFYIRYMNVHARLLWLNRGKTTAGRTFQSAKERQIGPLVSFRDNTEGLTPPARQEGRRRRIGSRRLNWLVAVAVAVSLMIGTIWFINLSRPGEQPAAPGPIVAHLVRTVGVAWGGGPQSPPAEFAKVPTIEFPAEPLHPGRKLLLQAGLAEIEYTSGARVVLQGPAEFVVRGPSSVSRGQEQSEIKNLNSEISGFLSHGKLTAQVPPQAAGFTIASPTLSAIDRGTQFGMVVRGPRSAANGQGDDKLSTTAVFSEVHVLSGEVEVAANINPTPALTTNLKSEIPNLISQLVSAGNAVRVEQSGAVEQTAVAPDDFLAARALLSDRAVVLDDDFNDGDVGHNVHGVGTGFDTMLMRVPLNSLVESEGAVRLNTVNGARLSRSEQQPVWIYSHDRFAVTGAVVEWRLRAAKSPIVVLALHGENAGHSVVELRILSGEGPGHANTLLLSAWSQANQRVEYIRQKCELAASGQIWDGTHDASVTLALTREGYEVSWTAAGRPGQSLAGKWSDRPGFDFAQFAGASGQVQLQMHPEPTDRQGSSLVLDRVIVTAPTATADNSVGQPR